MRRIALAVSCLALAGCFGGGTTTRTAHIRSDGTVSAGVRSAADAVPGETGPQELIGIALPLPGGFLAKAAILHSGQFPGVIVLPPVGGQAVPFSSPCAGPQTIMVPQTVMVPETRMVPQTRMVPHVAVPVPQAAPNPCAPQPPPIPQKASDPCAPMPPPPPPTACAPGGPCDLPE